MTRVVWRCRLGLALVALSLIGCQGRPGAGLTNPNAETLSSEDQPAMRTDLPAPPIEGAREGPVLPSEAGTGQPKAPDGPATPGSR